MVCMLQLSSAARGGMTSRAAVVARGMGRACVCGAGDVGLMVLQGLPHPAVSCWRVKLSLSMVVQAKSFLVLSRLFVKNSQALLPH